MLFYVRIVKIIFVPQKQYLGANNEIVKNNSN